MSSTLEILNRTVYREKLNTEQWKQFARAARERAGFACQICKRGNIRLDVHHIAYNEGMDIHEYANDEVIVLCSECHKEMHEQLQKFRKYVFGKMNPQAFKTINGALAVALSTYEPLVFAHALAEFVSTPSLVKRYSEAWGVEAQMSTGTTNRRSLPTAKESEER